MATWTNKAAALLTLALAACQQVGNLPGIGIPRDLRVLGDSFRVVGPSQYCPDAASLRESGSTAVVLLGRCSANSTVPPAVLSVAIGQDGSGSALAGQGAALAEYLLSPAGRASLSRRGRAEDVQIGAALLQDGVFLIRVIDRRLGQYWRGMVSAGGRLVSITATGPDLPEDRGRDLVERAARALQQANRRAGNPG